MYVEFIVINKKKRNRKISTYNTNNKDGPSTNAFQRFK